MPATPASSVAVPVLPARPKKTLLGRINEHRAVYLLLLPVLLYYLLFRYWPIGLSWVVSFKELSIGRGVWGSDWVGFGNFVEIFRPGIVKVIRNTMDRDAAHRVRVPGRSCWRFCSTTWRSPGSTTQTIVYIPHFFSWVIIWGIVFACSPPVMG